MNPNESNESKYSVRQNLTTTSHRTRGCCPTVACSIGIPPKCPGQCKRELVSPSHTTWSWSWGSRFPVLDSDRLYLFSLPFLEKSMPLLFLFYFSLFLSLFLFIPSSIPLLFPCYSSLFLFLILFLCLSHCVQILFANFQRVGQWDMIRKCFGTWDSNVMFFVLLCYRYK